MIRTITLFLFLMLSVNSSSDEEYTHQGVFIDDIQGDSQIMEKVSKAFKKRNWEVLTENSELVIGKLHHRYKESLLTIKVEGDSLNYYCECYILVRDMRSTSSKIIHARKEFFPENWIINLKNDVKDFMNNPVYQKQDIEQQLIGLNKRYHNKSITVDEYQKKRSVLLKQLEGLK